MTAPAAITPARARQMVRARAFADRFAARRDALPAPMRRRGWIWLARTLAPMGLASWQRDFMHDLTGVPQGWLTTPPPPPLRIDGHAYHRRRKARARRHR